MARLELLRQIVEKLKAAPKPKVKTLWVREMKRLLGPRSLFRLLTRAYLKDALSSLMATHGLALPNLSDASASPALGSLFPDDLENSCGDKALAMEIRACSPMKVAGEQKKRVVLAYVAAGGGDLAKLEELAPQLEGKLGAVAKELHGAGELQLEGCVVTALS